MTVTYRDATRADAAALDRIFDTVFCETFAHLYRKEDLDAFLASFGVADWEAQLSDAAFACRIAEVDGEPVGYVKLGPFETSRRGGQPGPPARPALHPQTVPRRRRRPFFDGLDPRGSAAARRRHGSTSPSMSTITAPGASTTAMASTRSAATTSWSATMPTKTSSCGRSSDRRRHPRGQSRPIPARLPRPARRHLRRRVRRTQRRLWQQRRPARRSPATAASPSLRYTPTPNLRRSTRSIQPKSLSPMRPGRRTSARAPMRWSPTGPICCSES